MSIEMTEAGSLSHRAEALSGTNPLAEEFFRRLVAGESLTDLLDGLELGEDRVRDVILQLVDLAPEMQAAAGVLRKRIESVRGDGSRLFRALRRTRGSPASLSWSATADGDRKWLGAAQIYGPGLYLSRRLYRTRAADGGRPTKPSDLADFDHAAYLPYMDFATIDRENFGEIQQYLQRVQPRRPLCLFRNGHFADLVAALEKSTQGE